MLKSVTTGVSVISIKMLHFRNPILYILFYSLQVLSSKESATSCSPRWSYPASSPLRSTGLVSGRVNTATRDRNYLFQTYFTILTAFIL